jgi:adenylyltransferase/sulfurtransferase
MSSRVAVIGCGALGSVIAEILVRAGVGYVRLVDRDFVDTSNLPRQSLFDEDDVAGVWPKSIAAARKLSRINSAACLEPLVTQVTARNIEQLTAGVDLTLDGTDNFPTRFLLNDAAVKHRRPWIFGAALAAKGMMMVVRPGLTPCLRCVLGTLPPAGSVPSCDQAGVLASTVHTVAALECVEALKFLAGRLDDLEKRLVDFDLWAGHFHYRGIASLVGHSGCPACEQSQFEYLDGMIEPPEVLAGRDGVQVMPVGDQQAVDLAALAGKLRRQQEVTANEYLIRFSAAGCVFTVFADGRAIIQGTTSPQVGRELYNQYVVQS